VGGGDRSSTEGAEDKVTEKRTECAKDDPEFARQQIEKSIQSGEIEREFGELMLRLRYQKKEENK